MSASLGLYRLQLVDSRMDEIRARLEEIRQTLENDEEMRWVKKQASETEAALTLSQHTLKQAEAEVNKQKVKIEQSEANLYSGNVKNPKGTARPAKRSCSAQSPLRNARRPPTRSHVGGRNSGTG